MARAGPGKFVGLIRPSLTTDLRRILDQYPDDGQILKELVQNAEDAGASQVCFLYDDNEFRSELLAHPDLSQHQGSALYAYNNAIFGPEDWTGISMYNDSVKEDDPLKVGRFGLGFKSVLHLTDLPSVLSDDGILMIDPTETFFKDERGDRATGCRWMLREEQAEMNKIQHQFDPYKGIFGVTENVFKRGRYPGTLFRFPLRKTKSKLSSVIYTATKIDSLFRQFEMEAHLILIFLKNIENIQIHKRSPGSETTVLQFEVKLAECSAAQIRKKREDFTNNVKRVRKTQTFKDFSHTYRLDLQTVKYDQKGTKRVKDYTYLVTEVYAGKVVCTEFALMDQPMDNTYIPLVGIAARVCDKVTPNPVSSTGHLFCFLPMPSEQRSSTGLPVHVNGYFAVSQNRRHLKWPTVNQDVTTDPCLLWNSVLLEKALPNAYIDFILSAVKLSIEEPTLITYNDVYHALPDMNRVDEKWQVVLKPVYQTLFQNKILHSITKKGVWRPLTDVVIDTLSETENIRPQLIKLLDQARITVVLPPKHILNAICHFWGSNHHTITPDLIRKTLRSLGPQAYREFTRESKILLLKYILDYQLCPTNEDLEGLELLPLADGTFTSFSCYGGVVYATSKKFPKHLFPGKEAMLLDDQLPAELHAILSNKTGSFQLQKLTPEATAVLLQDTFPSKWFTGQSCSINGVKPCEWLKNVWAYLQREHGGNSPSVLQLYEGLPLLPLQENASNVAGLKCPSNVILRSHHYATLPEGLDACLTRLGICIMDKLPSYISHPALMDNFVRRPLVKDVLDAIGTMHPSGLRRGVISELGTLTQEERHAFVRFIKTCSDIKYHPDALECIKDMPVFQARSRNSSRFDCPRNVKKCSDLHLLPVPITATFLDASDAHIRSLLLSLGVKYLRPASVILHYAIPEIQKTKNATAMSKLINYVFDNFHAFCRDEPDLIPALSNLQFVATQSFIVRPCDTFDPKDMFLLELFADEDVFPKEYLKFLGFLKAVGMKSKDDICSSDIVNCMKKIDELSCGPESGLAYRKGQQLMKFLSDNPHLLDQCHTGSSVRNLAQTYNWVPVMRERPPGYAASIPWPNSTCLTAKPQHVKPRKFLEISGSEQLILGGTCASTGIGGHFGWDDNPSYGTVTTHLKNLINNYTVSEKLDFIKYLIATVGHLLAEHSHQFMAEWKDKPWVWHGDGFTTIDHILLCKPEFDMRPFYYHMPDEMNKFVGHLRECGLIERCGPDNFIGILHQIQANSENSLHPTYLTRYLSLAIDVLNCLKRQHQNLSPTQKSRILFPMQPLADNPDHIELLPASLCTYCDQELEELDIGEDLHFIHSDIPAETAELLGVPALVSRLFADDNFTITDCGQGEPLTTRLRNLLQGYRDGFAVVKELIQNADDAGATKVKLVYDERGNTEWMQHLVDEGMEECQGPALWAYNDAVFTDEDFVNITKLGGATKSDTATKIGQFGLGFNAVYNITDVPSFLSRNSLVIFDPHLKHLGKAIRDQSQPGIKIDLGKRKHAFRKFKDHLNPFQGICGCNINAEGSILNGTLFRLPLRTAEQAQTSDICKESYNKAKVITLLKILEENSQALLLFTQNVCSVDVEHISPSGNPEKPVPLFTITKNVELVLQDIPATLNESSGDADRLTNLHVMKTLKAATAFIDTVQQSTLYKKQELAAASPKCSFIIEISIHKYTQLSIKKKLLQQASPRSDSNRWLIASCIGQGRSLEIAIENIENRKMIPTASVAIQLVREGNLYIPTDLTQDHSNIKGQAFCFLPLPIFTGLPVHINAPVFLDSSRKTILSRTHDDTKNTPLMAWNQALFEDAVLDAYILALKELTKIVTQNCIMTSLWPTQVPPDSICQHLAHGFFTKIMEYVIPFGVQDGQVTTYTNVLLLDIHIASVTAEALSALKQVRPDCHPLCLPDRLVDHLRIHQPYIIENHYYSLPRFYGEIIIPNITDLDVVQRDQLIYYALTLEQAELNCLLAKSACVPCSPDGTLLRAPTEIIHPYSPIKKLYTHDEGYFLMDGLFSRDRTLKLLTKLGLKDHLVWDDVVDRGKILSQQYHTSTEPSYNSIELLWTITSEMIQNAKETQRSHIEQAFKQLQCVPVLPVLAKPPYFPLEWKESIELKSAADLFPQNLMYLVSCSTYIIDDRKVPHLILEYLDIAKKQAAFTSVVEQFEQALETDMCPLTVQTLVKIMDHVYDYLQQNIDLKEVTELCEELSSKECILINDSFVCPTCIAKKMAQHLVCPPYLEVLPDRFVEKFDTLMTRLGVRPTFEPNDFMNVLSTLQHTHSGLPLSGKDLNKSITLLNGLVESMKSMDLQIKDITVGGDSVYLPNSKGVLKKSTTLHLNDGNDLESSETFSFTHVKVSREIAMHLCIKTSKEDIIARNSTQIGSPFGQKVELVNRIKSILNSYPCDKEILKELIQNADDAGATEIHFILDYRDHPKKRIFSKSWGALQGPALCVYNNRPFTDADIAGIQKLEEGSKRQDPIVTGQYGIGFSSVYHLTDVPSFLTSGENIGTALCAFDPHGLYVPGATKLQPGMQYNNTDKLSEMSPDVFSGYLTDILPLENATMFRLPLRHRNMAELSDICKEEMTLNKMKEILDGLKSELFMILLFLNNISTIKISKISKRGKKIINTYCITAKMSESDLTKISDFNRLKKKVSFDLKHHNITVDDIPCMNRTLLKDISDSDLTNEKWIVGLSLGILEKTVPDIIDKAFKDNNLLCLPLGGVAAMIDKKAERDHVRTSVSGQLFCCLPTPTKTGLPVHIHGQFALGYDNRRQLWSQGSYKQEWNSLLLSSVITTAYVNVLHHTKRYLLPTQCEETAVTFCGDENQIQILIHKFMERFPVVNHTHEYNMLCKSVVQLISTDNIFPCYQENTFDSSGGDSIVNMTNHNVWKIRWVNPNSEHGLHAVFILPRTTENNSDSSKAYKHKELIQCLRMCGCNLVEPYGHLVESFKGAEVDIAVLTPEFVISFLKSYPENIVCSIGCKIPDLVDKTFIGSVEKALNMLLYCLDADNFEHKMSGIPLLVTRDDKLRAFSTDYPTYQCGIDILSRRPDLFLHHSLCVEKIESLMSPLTIKAFAEHLEHQLKKDVYKTGDIAIAKPNQPSNVWLGQVWTFITQCVESRSLTEAMELLKPLRDWCLVPAVKSGKQMLIPLGKANTIIHYSEDKVKNEQMQSVFETLSIPLLDLNEWYKEKDLIVSLTATLDHPLHILDILFDIFTTDNYIGNAIDMEACHVLTNYFEEHVEGLKEQPDSVKKLLALPLFETIDNTKVALASYEIHVYPTYSPTDGVGVSCQKLGIVFLKENSLTNLYKFIGCNVIQETDLYCMYVLQRFDTLSQTCRLRHLQYLNDNYVKSRQYLNKRQKEAAYRIMCQLKRTPVIKTSHGVQMACEFYDPYVSVFSLFANTNNEITLLPYPQNGYFKNERSEWRALMVKIGMVTELTVRKYMQLATYVADQSACHNKSEEKQSMALVEYLMLKMKEEWNYIMPKIKDLAFISPHILSQNYQHAAKQEGIQLPDGRLKCIAFANSVPFRYRDVTWSACPFLPEWADPEEDYLFQEEADIDKQIYDLLQIQVSPKMTTIMTHIGNLNNTICKRDVAREYSAEFLTKIFSKIYKFIGKKTADETLSACLRETNLMLVDNGQRCVRPNQTVFNLVDDQQVKPYLFKIPPTFGEFLELFKYYGATESAAATQYAMIYSDIKAKLNELGEEVMNPNDVHRAQGSMIGLVNAIKRDPLNAASIEKLYLPTNSGNKLELANKLTFIDAPSFYDRLKTSKLQFLIDLRRYNLKVDDGEELVRLLPAKCRPTKLSDLVVETIHESTSTQAQQCDLAISLQKKIQSENFCDAMIRLIKHDAREGHRQISDEVVSRTIDRLSVMKIYSHTQVKTQLSFQKQDMVDSIQEKICFVQNDKLAHPELWTIYIKQNCAHTQHLLLRLAECLNKVTGNLLTESLIHLIMILECSEEMMDKQLDDLNVRPDNQEPSDAPEPLLPEPGSRVGGACERNLIASNGCLEEDEYVAYSPNGAAPFIHAIVVGNECNNNNEPQYVVRCGEQMIKIISGSFLFKFR